MSEHQPHAEAPLIPILYIDDADDGQKGLLSAVKSDSAKVGLVDGVKLARNLSMLCERLGNVFHAAQRATEGFELDQFEVAIEVTASGEVRLVGAVSTEVRGGVKLIFRRPRSWHEQ